MRSPVRRWRGGPARPARSLVLSLLLVAGCGGATGFPSSSAAGPSGSVPEGPGVSAGASPLAPDSRVTAFYYMWYGTAAHDGAWRHWNQDGHQPPGDIASIYYPQRGPYSSRDEAVLAAQMADLRRARIGVISVSWWGQGSWDDQSLPALFAAASAAGIKIAFHLEPYRGQTAASLESDIHYLLAGYGSSPALYRVARPTAASPSSTPRPVFYVFAPSRMPGPELKAALGRLRGTADDSIVMVHSPQPATAVRDGADGVYTYNPLASPDEFAGMAAGCKAANLICSTDVSPGFDNSQAVSTGVQRIPRADGLRYDAMWRSAIASGAEWIGVVSFDEWHEGTQIEPARDYSGDGRTYTGYEGAYGASASAAPDVYLLRTAYWVGQLANAAG